jgi:hypothetical protein
MRKLFDRGIHWYFSFDTCTENGEKKKKKNIPTVVRLMAA